MKMAMTIKSRQVKNAIIGLTMLSLMLIGISPNLVNNAYASSHCSWSNHCYAVAQRTISNDGNKQTVTIPNLSVPQCVPGSPDTTSMTILPQWVIFNTLRTDWIEVGVGEGLLAGSCYGSETVYTYESVNGGGWGIHSTVTVGNDYTFSMDDTASDRTWNIKKDSTTLRTVSTSYSNGKGEVGAEITHNQNTSVGLTHLKSISYYNGGWNLWTSSVSLPSVDSPLWRYVCTNYNHIHVGTGTQQTC